MHHPASARRPHPPRRWYLRARFRTRGQTGSSDGPGFRPRRVERLARVVRCARAERAVTGAGSRPNDFAIPGLAQRALSMYSASDAEQVWAAVTKALDDAAAAAGPQEQRRLATVVVGGGGATGVELAGELAEILPAVPPTESDAGGAVNGRQRRCGGRG